MIDLRQFPVLLSIASASVVLDDTSIIDTANVDLCKQILTDSNQSRSMGRLIHHHQLVGRISMLELVGCAISQLLPLVAHRKDEHSMKRVISLLFCHKATSALAQKTSIRAKWRKTGKCNHRREVDTKTEISC